MSPAIDGHPRSALIGSIRKMKPSQTTGASHSEGKINGQTTPAAPTIMDAMSTGFDNLTAAPWFNPLQIVTVKNSAVINSSGKIVANAQS
jgi:hypothetical protein